MNVSDHFANFLRVFQETYRVENKIQISGQTLLECLIYVVAVGTGLLM